MVNMQRNITNGISTDHPYVSHEETSAGRHAERHAGTRAEKRAETPASASRNLTRSDRATKLQAEKLIAPRHISRNKLTLFIRKALTWHAEPPDGERR